MQTALIAVLVLVAANCHAAAAHPSDPPTRAEVTRADLADAYLSFEQAAMAFADDPEQWGAVNREFDAITMLVFARRDADAFQRLREATLQMRVEGEPNAVEQILSGSKAFVTPFVLLGSERQQLQVQLAPIYSFQHVIEPINLDLIVRDRDGEALARQPIVLRVNQQGWLEDSTWQIDVPLPDEPSRYTVEIDTGSTAHALGSVAVLREEPNAQRSALQNRLRQIDDASLASAVSLCQARVRLLRNVLNQGVSASFLQDLYELSVSLQEEVDALVAGENPYAHRPGLLWRHIERGGIELPYWLYVPDSYRPDRPMPVVIGLHGVGGDEAMLMFGCNRGQLQELAERYEFILITPLTYPLVSMAELFDMMMQQLNDEFNIDQDAVSIMGHSMGVSVMSSLISARPSTFNAACGIAGVINVVTDTIPPTLIIAGETDPIIPPAAVQRAVNRLAQRAPESNIEYRVDPISGHTLVVPRVLEDAVQWMLEHRK